MKHISEVLPNVLDNLGHYMTRPEIKQEMYDKGISYRELGDRLGISSSYLNKALNYKVRMSADLAVRISKELLNGRV